MVRWGGEHMRGAVPARAKDGAGDGCTRDGYGRPAVRHDTGPGGPVMTGVAGSWRCAAVLGIVTLLTGGCGTEGGDERADSRPPTTAASEPTEPQGHIPAPARARKPPDDPFVWEAREILDHVGLGDARELLNGYRYELPGGEVCDVSVMISAMAVTLRHQSGDLILTNPSATAGLSFGPGSGSTATELQPNRPDPSQAACADAPVRDLDDLEAAPRNAHARQADLDALADALVQAAEALLPDEGQDPWWPDPDEDLLSWPGLETMTSADTITISGTSLGRCRHVQVERDGTATSPSSCCPSNRWHPRSPVPLRSGSTWLDAIPDGSLPQRSRQPWGPLLRSCGTSTVAGQVPCSRSSGWPVISAMSS